MISDPPIPQEKKDENLLAVVSLALVELKGAPFVARHRGVMFIATLLGHKMGVEQLKQQPWGTVGQCANCGQIAKAPRDGDSIEGRATYTICPAGRGTPAP